MNRRSFVQRLAMTLGAAGQRETAQARAFAAAQHEGRAPAAGTGFIRPGTIEVIHRSFDLIVVGGGISGTCAAISAGSQRLQRGLGS